MFPKYVSGVTDTDITTMASMVISKKWRQLPKVLSSWQRGQLNVIESETGIICLLRMWLIVQPKLEKGSYCEATWDNHYCWPTTNNGTVVTRTCSEIFQESEPMFGSHLDGNAYRVCQQNGTWLKGDWTNYTECANSYDAQLEHTDEEHELKEKVRYIVYFGCILSLVFLFTAISIFFCLKSLWCDRVTIHMHLMASLMLHHILQYIITDPFIFNGTESYRNVDWMCKAVLVAYQYASVCSVNWMFIQGIFLNGKLSTNVFDNEPPLKLYYTFGWFVPIPLLGFYAAAMEIDHPVKCWHGYSNMPEMWILLGPILVALLINVCILINILRILMTKVNETCRPNDAVQFCLLEVILFRFFILFMRHLKRAAKATIILSPILGINNLFFSYNPGGAYKNMFLILSSFFGSIQGFLVALVYCYLSSDVCSAIRRIFRRYLARWNARRLQRRRGNSSSISNDLILEQPVNRYRTRNSYSCNPPLPSSNIDMVSPTGCLRNSASFMSASHLAIRENSRSESASSSQQYRNPFILTINDIERTDQVSRSSAQNVNEGYVMIPLREIVNAALNE